MYCKNRYASNFFQNCCEQQNCCFEPHCHIRDCLKNPVFCVCPTGPQGPRGPRGPMEFMGPTGATGSTGPANFAGMQVSYSPGEFMLINDGDPVPFETIVTNASSSVVYNLTTSEFTISETGLYLVNWWIAVDGASSSPTINFAIVVDGGPTFSSGSAIVSEQLNGLALINVTTTPTTFMLINQSGDGAFIPDLPVSASLIITHLTN